MRFLVIDSGLFLEQANALSKGGKNQVLYWTGWETYDPDFTDYAAGLNFDNITKVKYLGEALDLIDKEKDVIVCFDVGRQDIIYILRKLGFTCLGGGKGLHLEQERWQMKKILQAAGLQINHAVKIKGTDNLKKYLSENKNKFIKSDTWRKDFESFYAKDLASVESIIDDREHILGPLKNDFEWIVEDTIDTDLEFGVDTFFAGGDYLKPYFLGIEYEKICYLARVMEELPEVLNETMMKMKPVFTKLDYRGPMSTEEKIVSSKEHYFLDFCARLFHPGSALYTEAIRNWSEVCEAMARGKNIRLDVREKYWGAVPIETSYAKKHWTPVDFPPELRKYIKLGTATKVGGKYHGVKNFEVVAIVVAGGNTIDEVITKLKKYAKEVNAYGVSTSALNGLDKISEIAQNGKKVGIDF